MIDVTNVKIGTVYGNGKGQFRKVKGFKSTLGLTTSKATGSDIEYKRCDENGEEKGQIRGCWCSTFSQWVKEEVNV